MADQSSTPQEQPESEPLTGQLAFRSTDSDKDALRLIAVWNQESESEVIRRHFDFVAFRAEAEAIYALRDSQPAQSVA